MKLPSCLLIILLLATTNAAFCQSVTGQVKEASPQANTVTLTGAKGDFHTFRTKFTTEILLNGKRATLKELPPGASVQVTRGEAGFAARIVSPAPTAQVKAAPAQSEVKISAMDGRAKPATIGAVVAGQRVTIMPKKVWWSGGGSRKGAFCDWRGYEGTNMSGKPWMALIAAVGSEESWPKDNTLSFTVSSAGVLTVFANDTAGEDNAGQGQVTVSISGP